MPIEDVAGAVKELIAEGKVKLVIEEQNEDRVSLWRPDHAGFDSKSTFESALIEE